MYVLKEKYKKEKKDSFLYLKKKTPEGCKAMNHTLSGAFIWEKKEKPKKFALFCEEFGTEQGYL